MNRCIVVTKLLLFNKGSNLVSRALVREDEVKKERPSNNWYQMTNFLAI